MLSSRGRELSRAQIGAGGEGASGYSLRGFRQPQLPHGIFRIELRDAFQAKKRIFFPRGVREQFRSLRILLDCFVSVVLFLLEKSVSSDALRRLLNRAAAQEAVINGERFVFVTWIDEHVEQQSVVNGREIGLLRA